MTRSPLIIAHRGASARAPENTLAAFHLAIELGADGVEFDVQLSRDGIPMVVHDYDLARTAGRPDKIADLTADELSHIDVGSWFGRRFPKFADPGFSSETIPTLTKVLEVYGSTKGLIYIELKCETGDYAPLVHAVCDTIRDTPILPRIIVKSFRLGAISLVRYLLPQVRTAALFEPSIMTILRSKRYIIAMAHEFGAQQLSLHHSLATPKLVALASQAQMPVTVWTCDDPKWISRFEKLGIFSLITNDPARMLGRNG